MAKDDCNPKPPPPPPPPPPEDKGWLDRLIGN